MKKILLFVTILIALSSCTVDYALKPSALSQSSNRVLYADVEENNIRFSARYGYVRESDVFFDVEITNNTDGDFQLSTKDFFYITCNNVADQTRVCSDMPVFAFDPSNERAMIKLAVEQSVSDEKVEKALVGVGLFFGVLGEILSDKPKEDKIAGAVGNTAVATGSYLAVDQTHEEYREYLEKEDRFWQKVALNDTIIHPGETVKGKVGFSYVAGRNDYYQLFLPTTRGDLMLEFETIIIE